MGGKHFIWDGYGIDPNGLKCPKCNKKTWHYALDENIVDIVKALNDKGYAIQYSCEGHYNDEGCTLSYFVIIGDVRDKFDLENVDYTLFNVKNGEINKNFILRYSYYVFLNSACIFEIFH